MTALCSAHKTYEISMSYFTLTILVVTKIWYGMYDGYVYILAMLKRKEVKVWKNDYPLAVEAVCPTASPKLP